MGWGIIKLVMHQLELCSKILLGEGELLDDFSTALLHFKMALNCLLGDSSEQQGRRSAEGDLGFTTVLIKYRAGGRVASHFGRYPFPHTASSSGS
jgi:hypothetical protein